MTACSLCEAQLPPEELDRLSGLDLCSPCRSRDPVPALAERGIPLEWGHKLGYFCAGAGLGEGADPGFRLSCVHQTAMHTVLKLFVTEVEVGDPLFDDLIYVRTSDREVAARLLSSEGVQSALIALLSNVRTDDLLSSHVTLDGPTLTLRLHPLQPLSPDEQLELELETAALLLLLREGFWTG